MIYTYIYIYLNDPLYTTGYTGTARICTALLQRGFYFYFLFYDEEYQYYGIESYHNIVPGKTQVHLKGVGTLLLTSLSSYTSYSYSSLFYIFKINQYTSDYLWLSS